MLADELDYVVGVDTHRDQHALAIVAAPTGALIAQQSVGADARGYAAACASPRSTRRACACGRSREPAITGPGFPLPRRT